MQKRNTSNPLQKQKKATVSTASKLHYNNQKVGTRRPKSGYETTEKWVRDDRKVGTRRPKSGYDFG